MGDEHDARLQMPDLRSGLPATAATLYPDKWAAAVADFERERRATIQGESDESTRRPSEKI
jgi:hypothetical protein